MQILNKLLFGVGSKQNKGKGSCNLPIQLNSGDQIYGAQQKGQWQHWWGKWQNWTKKSPSEHRVWNKIVVVSKNLVTGYIDRQKKKKKRIKAGRSERDWANTQKNSPIMLHLCRGCSVHHSAVREFSTVISSYPRHRLWPIRHMAITRPVHPHLLFTFTRTFTVRLI